MKGYKLLDDGLINEYGYKYDLNKKYYLNGKLKWNYNGFHFCTKIEDTLRYRNKENNSFVIVEVFASGNIVDGSTLENDYYGYESGYASDEIELLRVISREEMINIVLSSKNRDRITRLISSIKLTDNEINLIKSIYNTFEVIQYIDYYQYDIEDAFYRKKVIKTI